MVDDLTQTQNAKSRTAILVQGIGTLNKVLPPMRVGEIIPLLVRQNLGDGQGLISLYGQLVKAEIPPNLANGERVFAQIIDNSDKLTLKLISNELQGQKALQNNISAQTATVLSSLSNQLTELVSSSGANALQSSKPFQLPQEITQLIAGDKDLSKLFSAISAMESLFDPQNAHAQLIAASDGSLATALRETAKQIRVLVNSSVADWRISSLDFAQKELVRILQELSGGGTIPTKEAISSLRILQEQISANAANPLANPNDSRALNELLKGMHLVRSMPENAESTLRQLLNNLTQHLETARNSSKAELLTQSKSILTPASVGSSLSAPGEPVDQNSVNPPEINTRLLMHLRETALRVEQMAATLETLNQLNPIMQALGEPVLVLFPFLFQGMISQSEVAMSTRRSSKKKGSDQGDEEEALGEEEKGKSNYHQVHINLPLPNLGSIEASISYRPQELLVNFTTESKEVADFIETRLDELSQILHDSGFIRTELATRVDVPRKDPPSWCITLGSNRSIIA